MDFHSNVLLLNDNCYPTCPVCPNKEVSTFSSKVIEKILNTIRSGNYHPDEVYIGNEAFYDLEILKQVLKACKSKKIKPTLLTRGQFVNSIEEFNTLIKELYSHAPFNLLLVLDSTHLNLLGNYRLSCFLRGSKRAYVTPEMLYLLRNGETIPSSLLDNDEVNKYIMLYCQCADNLHTLFKHSNIYTISDPSLPEQDSILSYKETKQTLIKSDNNYFNFNALVLETTFLCNAKCNHCYTSCGPKASRERMPLSKVKNLLDEAAALSNIKKRCHIGGGEAPLFWDEMLEMLKYAKNKGFINSIVTNGSWGNSFKEALSKVVQLKEAGVCDIEFSVDAMHQEFATPNSISNILRAAKQMDLKVILRLCTTKDIRAVSVLEKLSPEDQKNIIIATSKVVPIGRASTAIPFESIWSEPGIPLGVCHHGLNLTVNPKGDVFPCCAGSELCSPLKLGNCYEQSLSEIVKMLRGNFLLRTLVHTGPVYLAALIKQAGMDHALLPNYANYCHLCNQIFTDPDLSNFIQCELDRKVMSIMKSVTISNDILKAVPTTL